MELCILGRKTTSIWRAWRTTQNECCRKIVDDFAHGWKHTRKDFDGLHWTNQEPAWRSSGQREIFEHNQKTYPSVSGLYGFQGRYSNTFYFRWQLISQNTLGSRTSRVSNCYEIIDIFPISTFNSICSYSVVIST